MAIGKSKLDELINRALTLSEATAWLNSFDSATKKDILDWIRIEQLTNKGVDKNDEIIGYYSFATEKITKGRKRAGDPYDLFDSGDFYKSMYITVLQDSILIDANSSTFTEMQKQDWFRNEILGLTDESMDKLKNKIKEKYIEYVRKVLQID